MGITARDLFFVLKVRDEASSALNSVTRDLFRIGAAAAAEDKRAEASRLRELAGQSRLSAAAQRELAERQKLNGATKQQIAATLAAARAHEDDAKQTFAEATSLDREAASLERSARSHQRVAKAMSDAGKAATIAGIAMAGAGALGVVALLSTAKAAEEYGRQVALTQTQIDGFSASQAQLAKIGIDTANSIAAPFEQMQETLYDIFSSTDANLAQGTVLLKAFSKAAVAGQVAIRDAADSTMGIMNAFKIPFEDVNNVLDVQFQLVRKGVGTYAQFSSVIGRAVPSAVRYGASLQDLAGSLAFLTRNGLSPAMAAASVARAFDALDNPKAINNMKELGINVYDTTGKLRPFTDVLGDLQKKILALPPKDRLQALTDVFKGAGGTIQARRFLDQILIGKNAPAQLKALKGFIDDMKNSTGQFGAAYDKMSKTVAAQSQLLHNRWETLKVTLGVIFLPIAVKVIGWISKLFMWFEKLSPTTQKWIGYILLAAAALSTVIGFAVVLVGGFLTLAGAAAALGIGFTEIAVAVGAIVAAIAGVVLGIIYFAKHSDQLKAIWAVIKKDAISLRDTLIQVWQKITDTYNTYLKPALEDFWQFLQNKVMPVIMQVAGQAITLWNTKIKEALRVIGDFIDKGLQVLADVITGVIKPIFADIAKWIKEHGDTIHKVITVIGQIIKWVMIIFGALIVLIIGGVIAAFVAFIAIVDGLLHVIDFLVHAVKLAWSWLKELGSAIATAAKALWNWLMKADDAMIKFGQAIPGKITGFFKGAGTWLYNIGKDIINGLIDGFKSKMSDLGNFLGGVGSFIKNHKGPKSKDLVMLKPHGGWIMSGLIRGIKESIPKLKGAVDSVTRVINPFASGVSSAHPAYAGTTYKPTPPPSEWQGKTINNHITVNTQEVNPRKQAAELGWELANKM